MLLGREGKLYAVPLQNGDLFWTDRHGGVVVCVCMCVCEVIGWWGWGEGDRLGKVEEKEGEERSGGRVT